MFEIYCLSNFQVCVTVLWAGVSGDLVLRCAQLRLARHCLAWDKPLERAFRECQGRRRRAVCLCLAGSSCTFPARSLVRTQESPANGAGQRVSRQHRDAQQASTCSEMLFESESGLPLLPSFSFA